MNLEKEVKQLTKDFKKASNLLTALGDETRQHLILGMMSVGNCNGLRVREITKTTNLSRPAVSHHLKILKEAGVVKVRREGTKNYYYFDPNIEKFKQLIDTLNSVLEISKNTPDRSGE